MNHVLTADWVVSPDITYVAGGLQISANQTHLVQPQPPAFLQKAYRKNGARFTSVCLKRTTRSPLFLPPTPAFSLHRGPQQTCSSRRRKSLQRREPRSVAFYCQRCASYNALPVLDGLVTPHLAFSTRLSWPSKTTRFLVYLRHLPELTPSRKSRCIRSHIRPQTPTDHYRCVNFP